MPTFGCYRNEVTTVKNANDILTTVFIHSPIFLRATGYKSEQLFASIYLWSAREVV
jgi:hypothetical protein